MNTIELKLGFGIVPPMRFTASTVTNWAAKTVCRHRRTFACRWLGQISYLIWRAYENRNFEMQSNGEEWILRRLVETKPQCVFDVGANIGDWTRLCHQHIPGAQIHAFEIAPPIFAALRNNAGNLPGVIVNSFGVSDDNGEIDIFYSEGSDYLTSAFPGYFGKRFTLPNMPVPQVRQIKARVERGDDYAKRKGVSMIDYLKIDVEGMEGAVLRGFREMLKAHQIRVIQFEYNTTNIVSGFLLHDAYQLLEEFGYTIGKLYPNYVEFREFHYRHEDFCGPNMIAVRKNDNEIIRLLDPAQ